MELKPPLTLELVFSHVPRLVAGSALGRSAKLRQVFDYILKETIAGRGAAINQQSIAREALGLGPEFDPMRNPVVRVHAGRLRRILSEYNSVDRPDDEVVIEMITGAYALSIMPARQSAGLGQNAVLPVIALIEFEGIDLDMNWARLPELFCKELGKKLALRRDLEWYGVVSQGRMRYERIRADVEENLSPVTYFVDGSIQQSSRGFVFRVRLLEAVTGVQLGAWKSPLPVVAAGLGELTVDVKNWIVESVVLLSENLAS